MSIEASSMGAGSERTILYLEDDDPTAYLFDHVLRGLTSTVRLYRVLDSASAVAFLRQERPFAAVPRPDVVILDINVPGESGFAVLRAIRSDPRLASLPVIMFSSSNATADRNEARELGVNGYMVKSSELSAYMATAELALRLAA